MFDYAMVDGSVSTCRGIGLSTAQHSPTSNDNKADNNDDDDDDDAFSENMGVCRLCTTKVWENVAEQEGKSLFKWKRQAGSEYPSMLINVFCEFSALKSRRAGARAAEVK